MSLGLSSTSDVITFDQNWHHLCSTSAGREDLSNDAQIRVIVRMKPEICTKMLKKWSEKLRPKFPATTPQWLVHGKNCPPRWCFLTSFLTASKPLEGQSLQHKRKKRSKRKAKKKKNSKNRKALRRRSLSRPKFWFLRMSKCHKTYCQWQESQAVVMQVHFWVD